jgi:FtsP/CotA-like multicopper oxidase with cupredoxin domain
MKKALRWIVPVAGIVAVIVLFLLLQPGDDGGSTPSPTETSTPMETASPTDTQSPESGVSTIEVTVANGAVDGPGEFEVNQGDDVEIIVHADVSDEVHVHGYDLHGDVTPDSPARISFTAEAPGIFEVELESAGLLLFELKVSP